MQVVPQGDWKRTHNCGELREGNVGAKVCLMGWVNRYRDHGGVIFIDLRDRYGLTQIVFDPSDYPDIFDIGDSLRNEYVIAIKGNVRNRPEGMANPKLPTGMIEVLVGEVKVLNVCKSLPIAVNEEGDEDERVRLRYRFLDLRRERMQKNLIFRSKMNKVVRDYFSGKDFLEIETPVLTKSTPEGARDFLVPSRLSKGSFYALPQSPQLFKQILMACCYDKYFQVVKAYRDEDLRADRQPEHTQIDLEMSFPDEEDIFSLIEELMKKMFKEGLDIDIEPPFRRMTYEEAMLKYGCDKPDLRYDLEVTDVTEVVRGSDFKVFEKVIASGGRIRGIRVPGGAAMTRKKIDDLITYSQKLGSTGLAWMKVNEEGLQSNIVKFFNKEKQQGFIREFGAQPGDLLTFVAGRAADICPILAAVRLEIARRMEMKPLEEFAFAWVTDFPLFEWDPTEKRWAPMHHIFSMPRDRDMKHLVDPDSDDYDPAKVYGRLYDLVLNGVELGSGSIRIHNTGLQQKVFDVIGIDEETAQERFGFLLEAFQYGAPPHGGIALGLDRLLAIMCGESSIREVIPFPKTSTGTCLMTGAPSTVDKAALREVGVKVNIPQEKQVDET